MNLSLTTEITLMNLERTKTIKSVTEMVSQITSSFIQAKEEVMMKALNYHQVLTEQIPDRVTVKIYFSEGIEQIYIDGNLVITFTNTFSKGPFSGFNIKEHYKSYDDSKDLNNEEIDLNENISIALYELELLHKKISPSPHSNIDRQFKTIIELLKESKAIQ